MHKNSSSRSLLCDSFALKPKHRGGAKLCVANFSSGESIGLAKFSNQSKNSSLFSEEKLHLIKVEVSLVDIQVNLRGKQVI